MNGADVVTAIVQILVGGLTSLGTGLGAGINNFVTALAFTGTGSEQTLSIYFIMVCVFASCALAIALTSRLFAWLSTLGN